MVLISFGLGVISFLDTSLKSNGKFILRVPPALHARLKNDARSAGCSLNEYCTEILESGSPGMGMDDAFARELIRRGKAILGETLVGIVVYGSWVRGEAGDASDIDVMLIADDSIKITRSLMTLWDEQPMAYEKRPVEAHFMAIPDPPQKFSGIWAEIAIDGIVLFERDFQVSRLLSIIRAEIASGRLQRRRSHGQNYWIHSTGEVA
jgi:hypothetical protein